MCVIIVHVGEFVCFPGYRRDLDQDTCSCETVTKNENLTLDCLFGSDAMARRRKNRTHNKGSVDAKTLNGTPGAPKSFVIKHGQVGHSITQLVRDMRKVMEPNTASRLKVMYCYRGSMTLQRGLIPKTVQERTRNKLKDYLVMGPALQVTHLLAFSLTQKSPTLKLVRLPAGPTLSFRLERYSLMKDVLTSRKRKRCIGMEYLTPPLVRSSTLSL
jgi:ribosome biogenesis protein SSF1/2